MALAGWGAFILWGGVGILLAELLRDGYHVLCHQVPWLARWHNRHHMAYRRDLSLVSLEAYRASQLYHDLAESVLLVLVLTLTAGLARIPGLWVGVVYALAFLGGATQRYVLGTVQTDYNHQPGPLLEPPSVWWVNRTYHWRHHFDNVNAYYSGVFSGVDKLLGTALSLRGRTIAITGASGALGQALSAALIRQGAKVIALTTHPERLAGREEMTVIPWQMGEEAALRERLARVDILVLNHGVNVYGQRTPEAIATAFEVNTFSTVRLMDLFLETVQGPEARARKEIWVNTSEAEVSPAFSPLYELSKRVLGDLVTLKRLDNPCVIRKLVLGPFKSPLNPFGVMTPQAVAGMIVALVKRDVRTIIVTINPLTYLLLPLRELAVTLYFRLCTRPAA